MNNLFQIITVFYRLTDAVFRSRSSAAPAHRRAMVLVLALVLAAALILAATGLALALAAAGRGGAGRGGVVPGPGRRGQHLQDCLDVELTSSHKVR